MEHYGRRAGQQTRGCTSCLLVIVSVVFAIVRPGQIQAEPCQPADLQKKTQALPSFIVVPSGSKPADALAQALGCEPPAPPKLSGGQPVSPSKLVGKQVYGYDGEHIGTITNTYEDRPGDVTSVWASMKPAGPYSGTHPVTMDLNKLSLHEGRLAIAADNLDSVMTGASPGLAAHPSLAKPASLWTTFCGWSDLCGMTDIHVTSEPSGAAVYFSGRRIGPTQIEALLRSTLLHSLDIELSGYKTCRFDDGIYTTPQQTGGDYATFHCKLTPVHSSQ